MITDVHIERDAKGRPTFLEVTKAGRRLTVIYDENRGFTIEGDRADIPELGELMKLIYPDIERVEVIGSISDSGIDQFHHRRLREEWLADGDYTERWNHGFQKQLYHGRTGSYWKSESDKSWDFEDWTLPEIVDNPIEYNSHPWNKAVNMTNSKNGTDLDQLYIGFPKAHFRQVMCFEAYLPTPAGGAPDQQYIGFEVNSGGSFALLVCLVCAAGQWQLYAIDYKNAAKTQNVTLRHSNDWARYALVYDPPILELWENNTNWPGSDIHPLELTATLDIGDIRGKAIPFLANEDSSISTFYVGNVWVYARPEQGYPAREPTLYALTCTNANTEYSQALPSNTKKVIIKPRANNVGFRVAFETGKVAGSTDPYWSIHSRTASETNNNTLVLEDLNTGSLTLYAATATAGAVLQVMAWT